MVETGDRRGIAGGIGILVRLWPLVPSLLAIWTTSAFATQDGPAHLYNAAILLSQLQGDPNAFGAAFEVRWRPVPNWAGVVAGMALLSTWPIALCERALATLSLVAVVAAVHGLRGCLGRRPSFAVDLLVGVLGLNVVWLMGFHSFLLGVALGLLTLAWWALGIGNVGRERCPIPPGPWAIGLTLAWTFGYFAHLVSLGLTVGTVAILTILGRDRIGRTRIGITMATIVVTLVPLGLMYRNLMRDGGGPIAPVWGHLESGILASVISQLTWVDPISLASKRALPLGEGVGASSLWIALSPMAWVIVGLLGLSVAATFANRGAIDGSNRGNWSVLGNRPGWLVAGFWIHAGLACPDTLGPTHGHYLPQRLMLWGGLLLAAVINKNPRIPRNHRSLATISYRIGMTALVVAWGVQTLWVFDYARLCGRRVGPLIEAGRTLGGTDARLGTVLVRTRSVFRANPLWHADCLVGLETNLTVWANYQCRHYYFPVQFRDPLASTLSSRLEELARIDGDDRESRRERVEGWRALLDAEHGRIDALLTWGAPSPELERVIAQRYEPMSIESRSSVRIDRRRMTPLHRPDELTGSVMDPDRPSPR